MAINAVHNNNIQRKFLSENQEMIIREACKRFSTDFTLLDTLRFVDLAPHNLEREMRSLVEARYL